MTKIDEHRAKLEALAHTHPWIREVVKELDRMKRITPLSCVNCEMRYWGQINILKGKVDKLTAERDMWRGIVGSMLDAADEIRRIADAAMPRGAATLVDPDGEVVG